MTHVSSAAQVSMDMDLWQVVAFGKDGSSGGRGVGGSEGGEGDEGYCDNIVAYWYISRNTHQCEVTR